MATGVAGEAGPGWGEDKRCAVVAIEIRLGRITIATVSFLMASRLYGTSLGDGIKRRRRQRLIISQVL